MSDFMYYTHSSPSGNITYILKDESSITMFPDDERNRHYQEYLAWLEEGNTPQEWKPE